MRDIPGLLFVDLNEDRFSIFELWSGNAAGDVNGDGRADLIFGNPYFSPEATQDTGAAVLQFGQADYSELRKDIGQGGQLVVATDSSYLFGPNVAGLGDINGDGFDDIGIVADESGFGDATSAAGRLYILFGSADGVQTDLDILESDRGYVIEGVTLPGYTEKDLAPVGDINGDGLDDFAINVTYYPDYFSEDVPPNDNTAWVVFGKQDQDDQPFDLAALTSEDGIAINESFFQDYNDGFIDQVDKSLVAGVGDVNADGFDDIAVTTSAGAFILYGTDAEFSEAVNQAELAAGQGLIITRGDGGPSDDQVYLNVTAAGDVNNDGIDDFLIGDPEADVATSGQTLDQAGRFWLVYGKSGGFGPKLDLSALGEDGVVFDGVDPAGGLGVDMASVGDINGDGIDDFAVISSEDSFSFRTKAWIVFGTADGFAPNFDLTTLDGTNGYVVTDHTGGEYVWNVDLTGDLDGDGFNDLMFAGFNDGFVDTSTMVLFGGPGLATMDEIDGARDGHLAVLTLLALPDATGGPDLIIGTPGDDDLFGLGGDDTLSGGAGYDILDGGAGADVMRGGTGADQFYVDNLGDVVIEQDSDSDDDYDLVISTVDFTLPDHVEVLTLKGEAIRGIGNAAGNDIIGNDMNNFLHIGVSGPGNYLEGLGGDDTLVGGHFFDYIIGGEGADLMMGGPGDDVYWVDNPGDVVVERARWAPTDTRLDPGDLVVSQIDFNLQGTAIENLVLFVDGLRGIGSDGNNYLRALGDAYLDGGRGVDTLEGDYGDQTYVLRNAHDTIVGEGATREDSEFYGNDTALTFGSFRLAQGVENILIQDVIGKTGDAVEGLVAIGNGLDNVVSGNATANMLQGRGGQDTLTGGGGADTFIFNTTIEERNIDTITDFTVGEDIIWIKSATLGNADRGALSADLFHLGDQASDAADRLMFDGATLWYDADGTGALEPLAIARFDGAPSLTASDILIV